MNSAYNQIPLDEQSRRLTEFVIENQQYEFNRLQLLKAAGQGKPNLVTDPIDISSDTSLSLPEILSLPSTPSTVSQTPTTTFPLNFSTFPLNRHVS